MSYTNPILTGGVPSGQSIFDVVEDPRHPVGTRAILPDGRAFYYACNRGAALGVGVLTKANEISGDFDDLATNTAAVGDTSVNVTPVSTATYAENELAGGYLSINSGTTGLGTQYVIKSHPATSAATAFDVELWDPIRVAFDSNTTATVVPNPWSDCLIADANETHLVNGATVVAVGAGTTDPQYFWVQTWGVATVLADAASIAIGQSIQTGTGTAGAFEAAAEGASTLPQIVGVNLFTTVDADYMPVFLQIAP